MQIGLVLKEVEVAPRQSAAPQVGQAKRLPGAKSISMSSRCASGSKSLRLTVHGGASPNACCSKEVSRMFGIPHSPGLPEPGDVLAAVNDAARRKRWPPAIIDRGYARRLADVRPGRRNGPRQPN